MTGHREQGAVASLLLALLAAAVLGAGLLLVVNRSVVDKAAVTAAPGTSTDDLQRTDGDTAPAGGAATDGPSGDLIGDTATTRPEPSSGQPAPSTPTADSARAGAGPDSLTGTPTGSGTAAPGTAADGTTASSEGAGPPAPGDATADPATPDPATAGTATAADTTTTPGLPYGTAAAERTAAQAPGELARTGPAVPSSVAVLLVAAGLVLAAVARAAAPGDD